MRLFLLILILSFSPTVFSADCHSSDIVSGGTYNCDNLIINSPINLNGLNNGMPVVINVSGNVEINASVTLNGESGSTIPALGTAFGGRAGPGGGAGGGFSSLGGTADGEDGFTSNGKTTQDDLVCGNGGGGGAFFTAGSDGVVCSQGTRPVASGGSSPPPTSEFDLATSTFRGGYGGGAGAYSGEEEFGSGGGSGGGLFILADGKITIKNGITLSARGGNGGNAFVDGGGGGAGSGGVILIRSKTSVTNRGIFDVRGGLGGKNNKTKSHGGNAGNGLWQIDINGDVTSGSGLSNFSDSSGFKSDISCGTLANPQEKNHLAFQMVSGFLLALLISWGIKILFLVQERFSSKFARRSF